MRLRAATPAEAADRDRLHHETRSPRKGAIPMLRPLSADSDPAEWLDDIPRGVWV